MSAKKSWYNFCFASDEEMEKYFPFIVLVTILSIVLFMCRGCETDIPDNNPQPVALVKNNIILQYKIF